jgi:hypothetical protein
MEKLHMGRTELPQDVIDEYLESLAQVYTAEVCESRVDLPCGINGKS